MTTVSAASNNTSHPLHTGSRGGGGAVGTTLGDRKGSGVTIGDSPALTVGESSVGSSVGSNCGLSEEDKTEFLS